MNSPQEMEGDVLHLQLAELFGIGERPVVDIVVVS